MKMNIDNPKKLFELIAQGESNCLEFKNGETRPESLAREMVSFSNTLGGTILFKKILLCYIYNSNERN
jgi:hypothetical protein